MASGHKKAPTGEGRGLGALHNREGRVNLVMSKSRLVLSIPNTSRVKTFRIWLDTPCGVKQDSGGAQVKSLEPKNPGSKSGDACEFVRELNSRCLSLPERVGADLLQTYSNLTAGYTEHVLD